MILLINIPYIKLQGIVTSETQIKSTICNISKESYKKAKANWKSLVKGLITKYYLYSIIPMILMILMIPIISMVLTIVIIWMILFILMRPKIVMISVIIMIHMLRLKNYTYYTIFTNGTRLHPFFYKFLKLYIKKYGSGHPNNTTRHL